MISLYFTLFPFFPNQLNDWIVQFTISIIASIIGAFLGYFLAMKAERNKRKQEEIAEIFKEKEKAKSIIRYYLLLLKDTQEFIKIHIKDYDTFIKRCNQNPCQSNILTTHADTSLHKLYSFQVDRMFEALYVLKNKSTGNTIKQDEFNTTTKCIDYIYIAFNEMDIMVDKHRSDIYEREKAIQSNLYSIIQTLRFLKSVENPKRQNEILKLLDSKNYEVDETDFFVIKNGLITPLYNWVQSENKLDMESEFKNTYFKLYSITQVCINQIDNIQSNTQNLCKILKSYIDMINELKNTLAEFDKKTSILVLEH